MTKTLTFIGLLIVFASCIRGNRQVVALRNLSSENIYFLISENSVLTNPYEIAKIRPITSGSITESSGVNYEDQELAERIKYNLYRYLVQKDCLVILLSSESAGIFVNSVSIHRIITDRFNGQVHIFIITESNLQRYSDQEIIDQKKYQFIKTLTPDDIKDDTLNLKYM